MVLPIVTIPDEFLRKKCRLIKLEELKTPKVQKFIGDLVETMKVADGVGLAAIQVRKNWQIFCVATEDGPQVYINPKLRNKSWSKEKQEEGCLSVPDVYGLVKRSKSVELHALDLHGKPLTLKAQGLLARVIQHENDHLNGVLFIDKIIEITKGQDKLMDLKKKQNG